MPDSEFALIERYFAAPAARRDDVVLGIGDDCALLAVPPGRHLAVGLDVLVAGTHFRADADPFGVGHKALAVNLSDLAAMGAEPAWVTLGLTLPRDADSAGWLDRFSRGFSALAARHGVALVGGDMTRGPLTIAVQAHGLVGDDALRRAGAAPGDRIFVTGTLGDAALALAEDAGGVPDRYRAALRERLQRPTPRVAAGRDLRGVASAAIDVSDGLAQDLGHILAASGVGATLAPQRLPLSAALRACPDPARARQAALAGGDDYELCFTVPQARLDALYERAAGWDCGCSEIGRIDAETGLRLQPDGFRYRLGGYDHFT